MTALRKLQQLHGTILGEKSPRTGSHNTALCLLFGKGRRKNFRTGAEPFHSDIAARHCGIASNRTLTDGNHFSFSVEPSSFSSLSPTRREHCKRATQRCSPRLPGIRPSINASNSSSSDFIATTTCSKATGPSSMESIQVGLRSHGVNRLPENLRQFSLRADGIKPHHTTTRTHVPAAKIAAYASTATAPGITNHFMCGGPGKAGGRAFPTRRQGIARPPLPARGGSGRQFCSACWGRSCCVQHRRRGWRHPHKCGATAYPQVQAIAPTSMPPQRGASGRTKPLSIGLRPPAKSLASQNTGSLVASLRPPSLRLSACCSDRSAA